MYVEIAIIRYQISLRVLLFEALPIPLFKPLGVGLVIGCLGHYSY